MSDTIKIIRSLSKSVYLAAEDYESIIAKLDNIDYEYSDLDDVKSEISCISSELQSLGFDLNDINEKLNDLEDLINELTEVDQPKIKKGFNLWNILVEYVQDFKSTHSYK